MVAFAPAWRGGAFVVQKPTPPFVLLLLRAVEIGAGRRLAECDFSAAPNRGPSPLSLRRSDKNLALSMWSQRLKRTGPSRSLSPPLCSRRWKVDPRQNAPTRQKERKRPEAYAGDRAVKQQATHTSAKPSQAAGPPTVSPETRNYRSSSKSAHAHTHSASPRRRKRKRDPSSSPSSSSPLLLFSSSSPPPPSTSLPVTMSANSDRRWSLARATEFFSGDGKPDMCVSLLPPSILIYSPTYLSSYPLCLCYDQVGHPRYDSRD